jgi:opacity protein-like surface antigen
MQSRIGYAMGPNGTWLPFITGGLAVGDVYAWDVLTPASGSKFMAGWTLGGGVETVRAPHWTLKVEYLYFDLGSAQLFNVVPTVPETVSLNGNLFRLGLNYRF